MRNNSIYEDGNGGQLVLRNNEIVQTKGLATLAYLYMFGGNVESSTQKENAIGELKFDWWGNDPNLNSSTWINSETERTLRGIELSSRSIYTIIKSVEKDTKPLQQYGDVSILVTIISANRLSIQITITEPSLKKENTLSLVWDATRNEIVEKNIL